MRDAPSILLYDDGSWAEGHYQSLFCLYTKACLNNGMTVHAACPRPDAVEHWLKIHCPQYESRCTIHPITSRPLKSKYRNLKPLIRLVWRMRAGRVIRKIHRATNRIDLVLFTNTHHLLGNVWTDRFTDLLMPYPWTSFTFDSSAVRPPDGQIDIRRLQQQFSFINAKQCTTFGVADEKMIEPMQQAFPTKRIVFLPDATLEETVESTPMTQEILRRAVGRKIVGLMGLLSRRKGLFTAIELAARRPDIFFVIAGACKVAPASDDGQFVQRAIEHSAENCFFHLKRIEDETQFNAFVALLDIVFAIYPGFTNTSGLLTKAGLFKKPCLVADGNTCMADRVKQYNIGLAIPPNDLPACSKAIDRLLGPESAQINANFNAFRKAFDEQALQKALAQLTSLQ